MIQKALSECMALILLTACYLIINDDADISISFYRNCCYAAIFGYFPSILNLFCVNCYEMACLNFTTFNNSIINDYFSLFIELLICFFSSIYLFII
jgi:hypothetical protein